MGTNNENQDKKKEKRNELISKTIFIYAVAVILGIIVVVFYNLNKAVTSDEFIISGKDANVAQVQEPIKYETYEDFNGKDLNTDNLSLGALDKNEAGYNFYPYKTVSDVYDAFSLGAAVNDLAEQAINISEQMEYNPDTNNINAETLTKEFSAVTDDNRAVVTVDTDAKLSDKASKITITTSSKDWKTTNKILQDILNNMELNDSLIESIVNANTGSEIIKYDTGEELTLTVNRDSISACQVTVSFYNNTETLNKDGYFRSESFENIDNLVKVNTYTPNNNPDYTFEPSENTFGTRFIDESAGTYGIKLNADSKKVEVSFNGIKLVDGTVQNEKMTYKTIADSEDGRYNFMVGQVYDGEQSNAEFDIALNNEDDKFTDEEKTQNDYSLILYMKYIDPENEVLSEEMMVETSVSNQYAVSETGKDGIVYMINHGYSDNAYALNVIKTELKNKAERSSDISKFE